MELQLTIFLGFVFLALVSNAALLWFVRGQLKQAADEASRHGPAVHTFLAELKDDFSRLEAVSERAAAWSVRTKERVYELDGDFGRVDNWVRYGLAKFDVRIDKAAERFQERTRWFAGVDRRGL